MLLCSSKHVSTCTLHQALSQARLYAENWLFFNVELRSALASCTLLSFAQRWSRELH
jgi:hypothetical protein